MPDATLSDPVLDGPESPAVRTALAYLAALAAKDRDAVDRLIADDVVHVTPFAATGGTEPFLRFDGREALLGHADSIAARYASMVLTDVHATAAADPDVAFVEAMGDMVVKPDRAYSNRYLYKVRLRDGLIVEILEYANPVTFAKVNGLPLG